MSVAFLSVSRKRRDGKPICGSQLKTIAYASVIVQIDHLDYIDHRFFSTNFDYIGLFSANIIYIGDMSSRRAIRSNGKVQILVYVIFERAS